MTPGRLQELRTQAILWHQGLPVSIAQVDELILEIERLRAVLTRIAGWDDDEACRASISAANARAALEDQS